MRRNDSKRSVRRRRIRRGSMKYRRTLERSRKEWIRERWK
jgi:hypothetical protein